MFRTKAKLKIAEELARGKAAREEGLEGRARVCARRAAGVAIREYLSLRGLEIPGPSAYDLLAYLQDLSVTPGDESVDISPEIRRAASRLLERVDESFTLPAEVDLLAEAGWLVKELEARVSPED